MVSVKPRDPFRPDYGKGQVLRTSDGLTHRFVRWDHKKKRCVLECTTDHKERCYRLEEIAK